MNIRDLRYVIAVADEKHFGRAALACNVSQPALSGQIRKLEGFLGVVLFERTNKSVQITPIGEQIIAQARQLVIQSDEIVATAQSAQSPFEGPFRLGMIATIGPYLSPLILPTIRQELPDVLLTLIEGMTINLEKQVVDGKLDGAIIATEPNDPHLSKICLYEEPFRVALSKAHPLAYQKTVSIGELSHEELLLLSDGHCLRDQVLDVCQFSTGATNSNTMETSMETLLSLVASGNGVTLAPALTASSVSWLGDQVVMREEPSGIAKRKVRLVSRASYPRLALLNRVASIIRANVPVALVNVLE
ncbi:MAG: LysR family transcriptional regulator [Rhodospirillales bacterium]|nr:LysR family transcriptional regulator [Rhodospirillales bacterium]